MEIVSESDNGDQLRLSIKPKGKVEYGMRDEVKEMAVYLLSRAFEWFSLEINSR